MEPMEVSVTDEEYMMTKAKSFLETDCYRCRSWLLTAKSMFPNNFGIHFECYEIEKNLRCVQRAARCFSCLLEDFPNEAILWKEIENFTPILCMDISCLSEEQTFFREMFSALPLSIQQKLLSVCAERSEDTMEHCRLVLLLLNRFPQSSTELALKLMDTMITAEKHNQCPNVINCYRKILVCDLGPLLVSTSTLNQKNLYKMLTKTTEFYITYAMGGHSIIQNLPDTENYIKTPWEDLFASCERIGKKLSWELRSVLSQSDKRKAWKKVSSFAKKFVIASNNSELSKQLVFCGMILFVRHVFDYNKSLKIENGSEYLLVKAIKGPKVQINKPPLKQAVLSIATKLNESLIGITDDSSEVLDHFKMAFNYWELLTNKEPMCTDYWKLSAQIKVDTFIGQFLNDIEFYQGKYKNLFKAVPVHESIRKSLSLVTLYYCVQEFKKCTEHIFEVVDQIESLSLYGSVSTEIANPPEDREMYYIQIAKLPVLQYCVKIMVQILYNQLSNYPSTSDILIGHLLVLSQMVWPEGKAIAEDMYNHIEKLPLFTYPQFSAYITNIDIIEHFMAMFIENDKCVLNVFPCVASSLSPRISTRGAGKGVKEEFRSTLKKQVKRWSEPVDETMLLFFKNERESLMKTATLMEKSLTF